MTVPGAFPRGFFSSSLPVFSICSRRDSYEHLAQVLRFLHLYELVQHSINIIYNFYNKAYSVKRTVIIKQEPFFENLNFLQNLDCSSY